jgi:hypothetical protein
LIGEIILDNNTNDSKVSKGMIARIFILFITAFIGIGFIYTMLSKGAVYETLFGNQGYFNELEHRSPGSYNSSMIPDATPTPSSLTTTQGTKAPATTAGSSLKPSSTTNPSPTASPAPTSTFVPLTKGMDDKKTNNNKVRELQTLLTKKGYYTGPPTGLFGDMTEDAVKYFQGKNGLPQTGIVDEATMTKLRAAKDKM